MQACAGVLGLSRACTRSKRLEQVAEQQTHKGQPIQSAKRGWQPLVVMRVPAKRASRAEKCSTTQR